MDKVSVATGQRIKHLVLVITATMQELIMRRNVELTVARLLSGGKK